MPYKRVRATDEADARRVATRRYGETPTQVVSLGDGRWHVALDSIPDRQWTEIGAALIGTPVDSGERISTGLLNEAIAGIVMRDLGALPFAPARAAEAVARECGLYFHRAGYSPALAPYCLVAVEHTGGRVYALDLGERLVVVAHDRIEVKV